MVDLTPIANAIISLLALLITTFLIPWIKAKVGSEKLAQTQTWVKIAVEAAEIIYKGTDLGEAKKAYVMRYLDSKGYTLDTDSIDAMIEAAVLELKSEGMEISTL